VNPLKQLAGQTAIYGLSSIIGRLINFLLVPLYAHIFLTSEFGVFAEMYAYVAFFLIVLTYGMETSFFRFSQTDQAHKETVFSTTLISILSTSALFILLVLLFRQPLAEVMRYPDNTEYITWLGIIIGLDSINTIPFARLRAENRPLRFASIKLIGIALNILLILLFLVLCPILDERGSVFFKPLLSIIYDPDIGVGYVFIANLITSIVTFLMLLPVMLRTQFVFSRALWRRMLVYALPLLVAGFAGVVNETLDKLLLKYMLPEDIAMSHVGIYSACYKLSVMMTIFIQAFRFAAEPFFFAQSANSHAPELYARVMKFFVIACLFIFLGILLFLDIVQYVVSEEYREGLRVVPQLLLANMFLGIYFNLSIWYKLTGQTHFGAWIALAGATITILLNIWWIPIWGYDGSAWATLICYFSMMALSYLLGKKHYPVPYESGKIIGFVLSAVGIYLLSTLLPDMSSWLRYPINFLLIAVFTGTVFLIDPYLQTLLKTANK
jgi:O-antigen/teichoic acid export membrane protein